MRPRVVIAALVLVCGAGALADCGGAVPTRARIEADEDRFCRAVARARVLEDEYGLNPNPSIPSGGGEGDSK